MTEAARHKQILMVFTLIRQSSSGMLSALCLLISLLQAVQMLALRGCGWNLAQAASPDKWICFKSSGFVTGILAGGRFYVKRLIAARGIQLALTFIAFFAVNFRFHYA